MTGVVVYLAITMEGVTSALLIGVLVVLVAKGVYHLISYMNMCRNLKQLYQLPSHWMLGNLDQMKDSTDFINVVESIVTEKCPRLYCLWFGPIPVVGVSHPDTVQQFIKQSGSSCKGHGLADPYRVIEPWVGDSLVGANGSSWDRKRRLLTPVFHTDAMKGYSLSMNESADIFLDLLETKSNKCQHSVEIMAMLSRATLETILKCSLSCQDQIQTLESKDHRYLAAIKTIADTIWNRLLNPIMLFDTIFNHSKAGRQFKESIATARGFTGEMLNERKKQLGERSEVDAVRKRNIDFLDILFSARDEDGTGLSMKEIHDEVELFTFAGHETTMAAISWATYALAKYPHIQTLVYEEITEVMGDSTQVSWGNLGKLEYLTCVIKESMRIYSPVAMLGRSMPHPVTIDNVVIPAGVRVDIPVFAIHKHPGTWPDTNEFRPDRFNKANRDSLHPFGFLPFSAGPRNCIGQNFAMNEIKVYIAKLLHRFEVSIDPDNEPRPIRQMVLSSENGVKITLKQR